MHRALLFFLLALGIAIGAAGQTPPPSPAERELQTPLVLDDGKLTQGQNSAQGPSAWRALGSLVIVLGLAGGALFLLRKYGAKRIPGSGGTRIKVEETLALGDRRFVSILSADEEKFLIAMSPQGLTLLSRLHGTEAAPEESFDDLLEHQIGRGGPIPVKEMERMIQEGQR
jgi:flagellar biogenesis protein FliO